MTKKISIIIIIIACSFLSYGQFLKYSNDFLNIGVSAHNLGMGNSVIANGNGLNSAFHNPATLNNLDSKFNISLMHSEYFAGIAKYDYAGFSYRLNDNTGLAISLIRLGIDDIQNTLFLFDENGNVDYDRIELFSVADYALVGSFGKKSSINGLSYGANATIIYRKQGDFANAYGFKIDCGVIYNISKWNLGASLSNATTSFTGWFYNLSDEMIEVFEQTGNEIPKNSLEITMPILNTGVGRYFKFSDNTGLNSEIDFIFTFDGKRNSVLSFNPISFYPQCGVEFDFKKLFFVRAGVNNFQLIPDFRNNQDSNFYRNKSFDFVPSIGLGIIYKNFYLDYALTDVANQSIALYSHIFSIGYKLN